MEIIGFDSPMNPGFFLPEKDASSTAPTAAAAMTSDMVNLSSPYMLSDDEVDSVLNETLGMIAQDSLAALSVHSGLNQGRVHALLGL